MPRKARQKSSTGVYHVMSRGLNKLPVFKQTREKTRMVNLIRENLSKYDVGVYAYCIMPNHIHLLIKAEVEELASFMAKILAAYAHYYNYKHNRIGYVFQGRFKSETVEEEAYFWNCIRYIHLNPSKEIKTVLDYKHSSLAEVYYAKKDIIHQDMEILCERRFASKQEFLEFHFRKNKDIFMDEDEDFWMCIVKISKDILSELHWKHGLELEEILEYSETKKEFKKLLSKTLHISGRKIQRLYDTIYKELKGTG